MIYVLLSITIAFAGSDAKLPPFPKNTGKPAIKEIDGEYVPQNKGRPANGKDDGNATYDGGSPDGGVKPMKGDPLFGVAKEKLSERDKYYRNGRLCQRAEFMDALSLVSSSVPSDNGLVRVTVIGTSAEHNNFRDSYYNSPHLSWLRTHSLLQVYGSNDRRVLDGGFVNTGTPTIYVQDPSGKVLWRQDNYAGGAEKLHAALRDRIPSYDPTKDPQPKNTVPDNPNVTPVKTGICPWWFVAFGLFLYVLYKSFWGK